MPEKIFFNSSLPRSGSTLFQNILAQNPDFYCTPTSGVFDLILSAKQYYQGAPEFKAQDGNLMDKGFFSFSKNAYFSFFEAITDKKYVIDKNRGLGIHYPLAKMFMPHEPKVVCMVRDIRAIYASMEKNFRKNPHRENYIQNPANMQGTTIEKRVDLWASGPPVGIALDRLKDIFSQKLDKHILFIRYEDLMDNPENEIKRFYSHIGVEYYKDHNFVKIEQLTHENDTFHGIYGDHQLRQDFKRLDDDFLDVLGVQLCNNIKATYPWFFDKFNYI